MNNKGFTLVELLIVVAIIAILAILALVSLTSAQERSRDTKRITDMKQLEIAMEYYWNENANYPAVKAGETNWQTVGEALKSWLPKMPTDPKSSKAYTYIINPENTDQFYVAAELENGTHVGLEQDTDNHVGKGWVMIDSKGNSSAVPEEGFNCGDPVYCLMGDATQ